MAFTRKLQTRQISAAALFYLEQLTASLRPGGFASIFRGDGSGFIGLKPHSPGDHPRRIDWPRTARSILSGGKVMVREDQEFRTIQIILAIDTTLSEEIGRSTSKRSQNLFFAELITELCLREGLEVGYLFFSDRVTKFFRPSTNEQTIEQALDMAGRQQDTKKTSLAAPFSQLAQFHKSSVVFLISDFIAPLDWKKYALSACKIHTIIPIAVLDDIEEKKKPSMYLPVRNVESGKQFFAGRQSSYLHRKELEAFFREVGLRAFFVGSGGGVGDWFRRLIKIFDELRERR